MIFLTEHLLFSNSLLIISSFPAIQPYDLQAMFAVSFHVDSI